MMLKKPIQQQVVDTQLVPSHVSSPNGIPNDDFEKRSASSHSPSHIESHAFRPQLSHSFRDSGDPPPPLPLQSLPYPAIVTHMSLMRPAVSGMDVRSGPAPPAAAMPFPFIGPDGSPFIPGQLPPPVSSGQHPGPAYMTGPNGQQQQMFPPFIPYPYFLVPSQAYSQMHEHQRSHLMDDSHMGLVYGEREVIIGPAGRAGSNLSHSSGGMRRNRNRNHRKQSASTTGSSSPSNMTHVPQSPHPQSPPHTDPPHTLPERHHSHPNHHQSNQRQPPVTPSHDAVTESRQTRSPSSSSSSHAVLAASPPTSLSSCPLSSDEEVAAANKQPDHVAEQSTGVTGSDPLLQAHQPEAVPTPNPVPAVVATSVPTESASQGSKSVISDKKKKNSPSATGHKVNGTSSPAAVPVVSSKPPSGPKSWSSLFKAQTAAPVSVAPSAAGIHTQSAQMFDRVCLGGTFDSIHDGHKKLLNESLSKCNEILTIGVTDESMIKKKLLWELIRPVEERIDAVRNYCESYLTEKGRSGLKLNIVPISDPFGPAITDVTLKAIVVSDETIAGATKINQIRQEKGMLLLQVVTISLVPSDHKECSIEEDKVSSSTLRIRRLGTFLKEPNAYVHPEERPYLIGLTGGIASGKTNILHELKRLGAGIIDCDKMAHLTYKPGSPVYQMIIKEFGRDVVDVRTNEIQRNRLGAKIFGNAMAKAKLESLVWPETKRLVFQEAQRLRAQDRKEVVVFEAAQLIEAKWTDRLHQVWVTIVPEDVAVKRLMERNALSEKDAKLRISSQMSNKERVSYANVVFSTIWDREVTRAQVQRAWNLLQKRFLRPV